MKAKRRERRHFYDCPHCGVGLQVEPQDAGTTVSCPDCDGRFQIPLPQAASASSGRSASTARDEYDLELNPGIMICVLISGITNIIVGLLWISSVCGAVIGIPQIVLAIFEIVYAAGVNKKPLHKALSDGKVLAILEIVSGFFNLISLVCGILVLVFVSNHELPED